jgi:imidazolonepropionase-like amidohydrolase/ABC-type multidrug transport system permease subunit
MKPYLAQIQSNLRLMLRDRSVLFFSYMFPMIFFFVFSEVFQAASNPGAMAQVIATVLILGVLGNGFFGAGMRTVTDRETNVLRRFKVAPISAAPIIVASMVSGLVAFLPTLFFFLVLAKVIYHAPFPPNLLSLIAFVSIGLVTFRAMGMIIAAVVNSAQEANIVIQILYLPMLFLSGATFPTSIMPVWVQSVAHFLPATYLFEGLKSIMVAGENLLANWEAAVGLLIAMSVALFVGVKLFRWEKEEKIAGSAKLWILAVLAPFIALGVYQAKTQDNITKSKVVDRQAARKRSRLFTNVRVFVGNGTVVPNGAVLVRDGKIVQLFGTPPADTKQFDASIIDSAGKTLMPGMIDMHVHLGAPGGVYKDLTKYGADQGQRRLAAYLYSGVTAVRSVGDMLDPVLKYRKAIASDQYEGAELFACGPLFTADGGHPEELLKNFPTEMRQQAKSQFLRQPHSAEEARRQVDNLKAKGVDCIKSVLEAGNSEWGLFNRLDAGIYQAITAEAAKLSLPTATHTGSVADMNLAVDAGTSSIEHGAMMEDIHDDLFARMKAANVAFDPTFSVYEALANSRSGRTSTLDDSLLQTVGPADLLADTRAALKSSKDLQPFEHYQQILDRIGQNLLRAHHAGVLLITGSDAGNMLVVHGPTVQHEMELWVKAGIPAADALQAATYNAAKVLRADKRIGLIQPGYDATFVLLDGDPVADISNTEHISDVFFRGEHIDRSDLFDQFKH